MDLDLSRVMTMDTGKFELVTPVMWALTVINLLRMEAIFLATTGDFKYYEKGGEITFFYFFFLF
jgi:hypothetical protein